MKSNAIGRTAGLACLCLAGLLMNCLAAAAGLVAPPSDASAAAVYVDAKAGQDTNAGTKEAPVRTITRAAELIQSRDNGLYTMRLNPGIHTIDKHVTLATQKEMTGRRIVVEASTLPDDPAWLPAHMPIVINTSALGELSADAASFVVSFLVAESHVTIRGIKFHGYFNPNSRYFPIARLDKAKSDLRVEQCMFVGDENAAHLQVGVIAHGDGIRIDHCVFYGARNAAVFWQEGSGTLKSGNALTHSIIVGAEQSAVWTAWPDKDFEFRGNLVSRCKHVWIKNATNAAHYEMADCIVVGNQHATAVAGDDGVHPEPFELRETNVAKSGEIALRLVEDLDQPLPRDYLHPVPGSLGYELHAGIFTK